MQRLVAVLVGARRAMYLLGPLAWITWARPSSMSEGLDMVVEWLPEALDSVVVWAGITGVLIFRGAATWLDRRPLPARPSASAVDGNRTTDKKRDGRKPRTPHRLMGPLDKSNGVVEFVDRLLALAMSRRASDVHLQPLAGITRVSLRIEGSLEVVAEPAARFHESIVRRLKVMADLVTFQTKTAQDGVLRIRTVEGDAEMRISVLPTKHGEKVVLRWVKTGAQLRRLEDLGLEPRAIEQIHEVLQRSQGLVVVTGPTGSGKSSSLYAMLTAIHESRGDTTQIATIEDPIEVELPFSSQTQVRPEDGVAFAESLRAVLRQDPNVLMIGEIRDVESARVAVRAGLSGHLVLTTLHAESAIGVFGRLIEMGVEPFLVASAVTAAVSQRLVSVLCRGCREPDTLGAADRRRLVEIGVASDARMWTAPGCRQCKQTGLAGRRAIFEILPVTGELRKLIARRAPASAIESQIGAAEHGASIRDELLRLALDGEISSMELLRLADPRS